MVKILLFSIWFAVHPVHVSLLSVDYVQEEEAFRVFVRVYIDDFLLDSGNTLQGNDSGDIYAENQALMKLVGKYLDEKIFIYVNNKQLSGKVEELESSEGEIRAGLLYYSGMKTKKITVKNYIMTGLYSDQSNMTIIKVDDFEEGIKLTPGQTEVTYKINN